MNTRLFLIVLMLHTFLFSNAQWSDDPSVNNVIANAPGEEVIPKIATLADGTTYIGWFSNENGNYNVRLQKLDVYGQLQWDDGGLLVSDHTSMSWLTDWDMTVDAAGCAILSFQDIRNSGNNNIYAYRISPEGEFLWGADGLELSNSTAFDVAPKIAVTNAGNVVIAWQSDEVIILQKIAPDGTLLWGDNGITLSSSNTYSWPQLLPVGDDEVILKFFEDSGPSWSPTRHVFAQRFDASGSPVWSQDAVISNAGGISAWTQILPFINDGNDGFYIAWHDDRDNNNLASIYVQHVDADGQVLFTANGVEASTMPGRNHFDAELALPPGSEDIFVFWNEMDGDQNNRGIYGQKISSSGDRLWTNNGKVFIEISPVNVFPFATRTSDSDMIVVYEEFSNAVNSGIKAMRIDTDGNYVWTGEQVDLCTVQSEKGHPVVNNYMNGQWIAAWEDNRSGSADIYGQNVQLDGTLGPVTLEGEVTVSPDTLFFDEAEQIKEIHVVNNTSGVYTVTDITENGMNCWTVDPYPDLPYDIAPGDSLILDVYVYCITLHPSRDYLYENLYISSESETDTVVIAVDESLLVGINESADNNLEVYPNPAKDIVNFRFRNQEQEGTRLLIFNLTGQRVKTIRPGNRQIFQWNTIGDNGQKVSPGTYYYRLISDGIQESGRIVLIR